MDSEGGTSHCDNFEASIVPVCCPSKARAKGYSAADRGEVLMAGEKRWKKDQLYYNPLLDKNTHSYLTVPSVMQHLKKQGVVASVSTCIDCLICSKKNFELLQSLF